VASPSGRVRGVVSAAFSEPTKFVWVETVMATDKVGTLTLALVYWNDPSNWLSKWN
jgi:hypothetical protein